MKAKSIASVGIVPEVLNFDNYDRWSVFMENYLIGKGLWDDVIEIGSDHDIEQGHGEDKTEYSRRMKNAKALSKKKNAKALHIIQISCERHIQNELFHFHDANSAWFYLGSRYGKISSEAYASRKGVTSGGIVHQVLTKDNYERWRSVMQNYLQEQDLWDDIIIDNEDAADTDKPIKDHQTSKKMKEGNTSHISQLSKAIPDIEQDLLGVVQSVPKVETEVARKTKDAKALHIIQLSCGREIVDEISHFTTAKKAWNYLSSRYGKVILDESFGAQHRELLMKVARAHHIELILNASNADVHVITSSTTGRTLLHVAVIAGNVDNVKILMKKGTERLLLMQDKDGDTALSLVARYTGNTDMAKCMVETKNGPRENLLELQNKDNITPILMAAANGHKELTTYLYSQTLSESKLFDITDSQYRILLLSLCITAEIFDVALKLLKRYENLPKESLSVYNFSVPKLLRESLSLPNKIVELDSNQQPLPDKFSALVALAKMPSAFPSGNQFSHREQFIYDILSVENEIRDEYQIHGIEKFVQKAIHSTIDNDKRPLKTSSIVRIGFGRHVLNSPLLVMRYGWRFCKLLVSMFLVWPVKLLGLILRGIFYGIAYLFIHFFKFLNIFGVRRIYDMKYTHYKVIGILSYFCQSIVEFNDSQLKEASAYESMLHGAQHGIIEFINAMRKANPELLSAIDSCHRGIFSYAVFHRKKNVFQLIYSLRGRKEIHRSRIDTFGNNLLHLAAQLGPSSDRDGRSGAALQMQREIQWFNAVEDVMHPRMKEARNIDGKKPYEMFTENHVELVKAGEEWTKDTAKQYIAVASLILTITFAAAFTVPGGNNQETGTPIFLHEKIFNMFIIADALSIFISASSVLVFIGILTSRYSGRDFLKVLPLKLVLALVLLILSVCSMMVAFYAALNVILKGNHNSGSRWFVLGPILALGSVPVFILLISQLGFIYKILHSTIRNPISSI